MKVEVCAFSGGKIYPGRGRLLVRSDCRTVRIINKKCESHFLKKKNPRKFHWTVMYRRLHKKGATEAVAKRKVRRVVKSTRGIVGASTEMIQEKRSQTAELREAARSEAISAAKEKKKQDQQKKRQEKVKQLASKGATAPPKMKPVKNVKMAKPMAKSR